MLDEPALAGDAEFFRLGSMALSPDGHLLAYATDHSGDERYTVRVRDLRSGRDLPDRICNAGGSLTWAADNRTLFYTRLSEQWRPYLVRRHTLGTPESADADVYRETDDSFFVGIGATHSHAYLVISSGDHVTSELRVLSAVRPTETPRLVAPRRAGASVRSGPPGRVVLSC